MKQVSKTIHISDSKKKNLLGDRLGNKLTIEKRLLIQITVIDKGIEVKGSKQELKKFEKILGKLLKIVNTEKKLTKNDVKKVVHDCNEETSGRITISNSDSYIKPKTEGQENYIKAIENNTIIFCTGPAGTGKTYLAVTAGCRMLASGEVKRMVITRPVVEAGESLGFLPGDLKDKIDPYLAPIYDVLHEIFGAEKVDNLVKLKTIDIVPLAFMRGRSLKNAVIILDEAQNCTADQLFMFMTRIGDGSKQIITGDKTQTDLVNLKYGLKDAKTRLSGLPNIKFVELTVKDIRRHSIISSIVKAYKGVLVGDDE